jgi:hypothetical protein
MAFALLLWASADVLCAMLVAAIERVIRANDEGFSPLDEGSREKARDQSDNYLLHKRRVHIFFGARAVPWNLPETPLLGPHDPQPEKQVCDCVNDDT